MDLKSREEDCPVTHVKSRAVLEKQLNVGLMNALLCGFFLFKIARKAHNMSK